jgi:transposase-like protein
MQKRLSEEQIIAILREAEAGERTISEVCRAHGIPRTSSTPASPLRWNAASRS